MLLKPEWFDSIAETDGRCRTFMYRVVLNLSRWNEMAKEPRPMPPTPTPPPSPSEGETEIERRTPRKHAPRSGEPQPQRTEPAKMPIPSRAPKPDYYPLPDRVDEPTRRESETERERRSGK